MKKAQLEQQFAMIFGVVVIVFVLIYGSYVIIKTIHLSSQIEFKDFLEKLDKEVIDCYNLDFGSICSLNKLEKPSNLDYICFINKEEVLDESKLPRNLNNTIIKFIRLNRDENVFLNSLSSKGDLITKRIDKLRASENPLCTKNIKNLVVENKGTFVIIRT